MKTIDKKNPILDSLIDDNREVWSGRDPLYCYLTGHGLEIQNRIRRTSYGTE